MMRMAGRGTIMAYLGTMLAMVILVLIAFVPTHPAYFFTQH
jgi:hypothetical protein